MNIERLLEWLAFAGILLLLIYTLFVIGDEKDTFLENAKDITFSIFDLKVPHWWSSKIISSEEIKFERTDSRYDWYVCLKKISSSELEGGAYLEEILSQKKIVMDKDSTDVTEPNIGFEIAGEFKIFRIEGTGTEDETDRIYMDIFLVQNSNSTFLFESKSSVLNGMVEGPYFEEVIKRMQLKKD